MSCPRSAMFTVNDVKQYLYCPRVVYFTYCMPVRRRSTFKMDLGKDLHEVIERLESRRKLRRYRLSEGRRMFEVPLRSEALNLSGKLDMLIELSGEYIPVDFKHTFGRPRRNHRYQLAAYGLLVEENLGPVKRGFLYLIPQEDAVSVELTPELKERVRQVVREMEEMVSSERMPPPAPRSRCYDCELRRFCGDVF